MNSLHNLIQKEPSLIPNNPYQIIGQLNWHVSGERTIYLAKIPKSGLLQTNTASKLYKVFNYTQLDFYRLLSGVKAPRRPPLFA